MIVTVTDLYDGVTPETSPITISVIEGSATSGSGGGAVDSVNGHVGVVVLDADDLADGTTNHVFTALDDTKLAGIATGATANDTDANLKARGNHTGSQAISTVTGLQAALDDKDAALAAHEAAANPHPGYLTPVEGDAAYDALGAASTAQSAAISAAATDATTKANAAQAAAVQRANHTGTQSADTLTDGTTNKAFLATERTKLTGIATSATANDTDANLKARANHTGTQALSTISDAGTAAALNSGTTSGTVPVLGTGGLVAPARLAASLATGDLLYYDGSALVRLAKGTAGDVLTAGASVPAYATPVAASPDGITLGGANDLAFTGSGSTLAASSLATDYAWYNQSTARVTEGNGRLMLFSPTGTYLHGVLRTIPGTFNSFMVRFSALLGASNEGFGIALRDSVSDKKVHFTVRGGNDSHLTYWNAGDSSTPTDRTAGAGLSSSVGAVTDYYVKVVKNSASSWDFMQGPWPVDFLTSFPTENIPAATGGFTPNQIGVFFLTQSTGAKVAAIDYFKFT